MPRGRPRTRPVRTTPKRPYHKSGRYTKAKKAERAFRKTRRGELKNYQEDMPGFELETRRGNRGVYIDPSPIANVGWQRRGKKAKIANKVPSF